MGNCIARSSGAELFHAVTAGDKERALDRVHETPLLLFKQRGDYKRTVWHECAANGQLDVLRALVHHVRDTVPRDEQSAKPVTGRIHPAIRDAINSFDRDGYPALILACKAGHHEMATFLLDQVRPCHGVLPCGTSLPLIRALRLESHQGLLHVTDCAVCSGRLCLVRCV